MENCLFNSTAEQSNSDDIWQQFQDNSPYLADYIASNPELVWSGSNVDRNTPNFFVDVAGPDNDISTIDANDWRLTVSAGDELSALRAGLKREYRIRSLASSLT